MNRTVPRALPDVLGLGDALPGIFEPPRVAAVAGALRGYDRSPRQEPRQKPQRLYPDLWVLPICTVGSA